MFGSDQRTLLSQLHFHNAQRKDGTIHIAGGRMESSWCIEKIINDMSKMPYISKIVISSAWSALLNDSNFFMKYTIISMERSSEALKISSSNSVELIPDQNFTSLWH